MQNIAKSNPDMIMFDDLWQLPQIKPPSVVGVQGLRYWIA